MLELGLEHRLCSCQRICDYAFGCQHNADYFELTNTWLVDPCLSVTRSILLHFQNCHSYCADYLLIPSTIDISDYHCILKAFVDLSMDYKYIPHNSFAYYTIDIDHFALDELDHIDLPISSHYFGVLAFQYS